MELVGVGFTILIIIIANVLTPLAKRLLSPLLLQFGVADLDAKKDEDRDEKEEDPPLTLTSPLEAIEHDLKGPLDEVRKQINIHWKTKNFPAQINVTPDPSSYCPQDQLVPIIAGLLEREGWVVTKSDSRDPFTFMIDLPRKRF